MGRVARTDGSSSGIRAGESVGKNIGKSRTKLRKRKDLEVLHRNVLEAKHKLRVQAPQKKKRKTALGKVLKNFADKRQENDNTSHGLPDKKGRRTKPRIIGDKLLPDPILGIYQNGVKGKEIQRVPFIRAFDKIKTARLEGDVLKLLNGDETNSKSKLPGWSEAEKQADKTKESEVLSFDESDYASLNESRVSRADTSAILNEPKGVNRINEGKKKTDLPAVDIIPPATDENQLFFKRNDKCKRRLFETDEEQGDSKKIINISDRSNVENTEICFSPPRCRVSPSRDNFVEKQSENSTDIEITKKDKNNSIEDNFSDWSSTIHYERLCAMICSDNFESNWCHEVTGSDPIVKIRKRLHDFHEKACRYRRSGWKIVNDKGSNELRDRALSKVNLPSENSSLPTTSSGVEIQACTGVSELDEESSMDSDSTKVGSWRPPTRQFSGIFDSKDSSIFPVANETILESRDDDKQIIQSRDDNPLNVNIFEMKTIASKKEHSSNYSLEKPHRDLTYDINLGNLVQRNTKHVPTILRRSTNRCVERVDDNRYHRQRKPSDNWPIDIPKRSSRTTAGLSRCSTTKSIDTDYLRTPSVVNNLAAIDRAKVKIHKSKSNLIRAKYRPDARSSLSNYRKFEQLLENHDKYKAKDGNVSSSENFFDTTSIDNHKWHEKYSRNSTIFQENKNEKIDSRKIKEPRFGSFEKQSAEYNSPRYDNIHENASKFPFEFARPDIVSKKIETRDREIFGKKIENISQRIMDKNIEDTFLRSRHLTEDSISLAPTKLSRHPKSSRWLNEIQYSPEKYNDRMSSKLRDLNYKPSGSYQEYSESRDRFVNGTNVCEEAQHCQDVAFRRHVRKPPVMLFRPIQEVSQQREMNDSRYRLPENGESTLNDAVKNFRVLTFNDNTRINSSSILQRRNSQDTCNLRYPNQRESLSQPNCCRRTTDENERHSQEFDCQPTKYLAFDESDCRNPCRIPIYVNSETSRVTEAASNCPYNRETEGTKLFNMFAKPDNTENMCLRWHHDVENSNRQHTAKIQCCGQQQQQQQQQQLQELGPRRGSQVTLMLPHSGGVLCQETSNNLAATTAPTTTFEPTSIKDIPRVVYSMTACETLVQPEMTYQPSVYPQSRYENNNLSKRVQLPDGRVGILVTENSSIDNQDRTNSNAPKTLNFDRIDLVNFHERNHSGAAKERIYY